MLKNIKYISVLFVLLLFVQKAQAAAVLTEAYWQGTNLVLQFSDSVLYQVDLVNTDTSNVAVNLIGANLSAVSSTNSKVEPFVIDAPGGLSRATLTQLKKNLVTLKIKLLPQHSYSVLWRPYSNRFYVYTHDWNKLTPAEKEFHKGLIALENGLKEQVEKQLATSAALGNKNARSVLGVFYAKVGSDELAEQYLANPTEADDYAALAEVKTRSGDKGLAFSYERKFQNMMKAQRFNSQDDSIAIVTGSQIFLDQLREQKRKRSGILNSLNDPMFITTILLVILLFITIVFLLIRRSSNNGGEKPMSKKDFFKSSSRKKYYDYNNDYSNYYNKRKQDINGSVEQATLSNDKPSGGKDEQSQGNVQQEENYLHDKAENPLKIYNFRQTDKTSLDTATGDEIVSQAKSIIDEKEKIKDGNVSSEEFSSEDIIKDEIIATEPHKNEILGVEGIENLQQAKLEKDNLDKQIQDDMLNDEALSELLVKNKQEQMQQGIDKANSELKTEDLKTDEVKDYEAKDYEAKYEGVENEEQLRIIDKYDEPEIYRFTEEQELEIKNEDAEKQVIKPLTEKLNIPTINNEFLRHSRYAHKNSDKPKQLSLQALELRKKIEALQEASSIAEDEDLSNNELSQKENKNFTQDKKNRNFAEQRIIISSGKPTGKRLSTPTVGEEAVEIMLQARAEKVSRDYIMLKQLMSQVNIYPRQT